MKRKINVKNNYRYSFLILFSVIVIFFSFVFDKPLDILHGYFNILISPSNLLTDYMAVGGIGATFFNAGLLLLIAIVILKYIDVILTGPIVAGLFIFFSFSFFGKNLFNTIPIVVGVYLYSKSQNVKFNNVILYCLFGTALSPVVSYICFGLDMSFKKGIIISYLVGIGIGLIIPPLAASFIRFHQGYTLYNVGFTCGVIGLFIQGVLHSFSLSIENVSILSYENNLIIFSFMYVFLIIVLIIGYILNGKSLDKLEDLLKTSGRTPSDYLSIYGDGVAMINMAFLGIFFTTFVLVVNQPLNGPVLGSLFTIVGFGAFGKHLKNVLPIVFGTLIAYIFNIYDMDNVSSLITILFSTNLAPIAGEYGIFAGIIAGFLHVSIVSNVGVLHGGFNLYNNGFAGGFVAAILVPIFDAIRTSRFFDKEDNFFE